jgi:ApbE superfamily uncharacterized protein (UPF0280 family)
VPLFKRKPQSFTLQVQDILFRVTAPEEYYEECRAAALSVWEQLSAYSVRDPQFRTSKRPVDVRDDAAPLIREMAETARMAGVGPVFTIQGAITDHVGRYLARSLPEVLVSSGGDYFIRSKRRMKLVVHHTPDGRPLSVVVDPRHATNGVSTTFGRDQLPARSVDGLTVLASSCMLADAASAAAMAILSRPNELRQALAYLREIPGLHGAVVFQGERIGVVGGLEVAA